MKPRPIALTIFSALAVLMSAFDLASAQSYATRPIRLLVSYPPGGATDISARLIAPQLGEILKQQMIVDNRPGASGMIGTTLLARAAPDGHTIMVVDVAHGANPALNDNAWIPRLNLQYSKVWDERSIGLHSLRVVPKDARQD